MKKKIISKKKFQTLNDMPAIKKAKDKNINKGETKILFTNHPSGYLYAKD